MSKNKSKKKSKKKKESQHVAENVNDTTTAVSKSTSPPPPMKAKEFNKEIKKLQGQLVTMQQWVVSTGAKVCIVFEGRDTAGKGGVIKRITERTSPRVFRHIALSAPTDREKSLL